MRTSIFMILLVPVLLGFALTGSCPAAEAAGAEHSHNSSFSWFGLVKPLGIATLSCLCVTFLTGLFRGKLKRRFLKIHRPLAIITLILGLTHGTLVYVLFN